MSSWEVEGNVMAADLMGRFWENVGITREKFNNNEGNKIEATPQFIGE